MKIYFIFKLTLCPAQFLVPAEMMYPVPRDGQVLGPCRRSVFKPIFDWVASLKSANTGWECTTVLMGRQNWEKRHQQPTPQASRTIASGGNCRFQKKFSSPCSSKFSRPHWLWGHTSPTWKSWHRWYTRNWSKILLSLRSIRLPHGVRQSLLKNREETTIEKYQQKNEMCSALAAAAILVNVPGTFRLLYILLFHFISFEWFRDFESDSDASNDVKRQWQL